jgi:hypothetical protein
MHALAGKNYRKYKAPVLPTSSIDQPDLRIVVFNITKGISLLVVVETMREKQRFIVDCRIYSVAHRVNLNRLA